MFFYVCRRAGLHRTREQSDVFKITYSNNCKGRKDYRNRKIFLHKYLASDSILSKIVHFCDKN